MDLRGRAATIVLPESWTRVAVPNIEVGWVAPAAYRGFRPNATLVLTDGGGPRGDALAEETAVAVVGALDDAALIDLDVVSDVEVRLVVAHRFGAHRLTLLQRVLVDEAVTATLSVSIPDLWLAELREQWEVPLRTLTIGTGDAG